MKLTKQKVFVCAIVISLVAILSFGTLAWFSDSDSVTNKFMTATSDDTDADTVFNVDIYETVPDGDDDDTDPDIVDKGDNVDEGTDPEYTYEGVLPGDKLVKAPVVENTGKYAQYVRVKITVSDASYWVALAERDGFALEDLFVIDDPDEFAANWDREIAETEVDGNADTMTYVYYCKKVLNPNDKVALFDAVQVPTTLTKEDLVDEIGTDGFSLKLVAEAVQADNTGDTAQEAFATVFPTAQP